MNSPIVSTILGKRVLRYAAGLTVAVVAALFALPGIIQPLLRGDQFMPHATCYLSNPQIILLHVSSDLLIGTAYVCISGTLGYLVYKASRDIPFHWMFLAFGLFIITCGLTHFMEVWTVWRAVYWLAGYVKLICAIASVATAIALFPLVPKIFGLVQAVKVSERRRLELEEANKELEAFVYTVSHDLRAPLRTINGMADVVLEDYGPTLDTECAGYLDRMRAASMRMDTLITELLEYSKISRAEFTIESVDLAQVVGDVRAAMAAEVEQRKAELSFEGPLPPVLANRILLTQVFSNLLSNAVKFVAPEIQPQVRVFTEPTGERLRICVQDNGIGIAEEHREKVFRIFERLHNGKQYAGTGIGLAIVQRAVQRMRGSISLDSTLGKGSCFCVELPVAAAAPATLDPRMM